MSEFRCGYVALLGRPNVGKSTLLNTLLGQKVSIVTPKPQTTRHRILGIDTTADSQIIYIDTPGMHRNQKRALNQAMNRAASSSMADADLLVLVFEALHWSGEDQDVLDQASATGRPMIAVVSKVDKVQPRAALMPVLQQMATRAQFEEIIPVSSHRGSNINTLRTAVLARLPAGPQLFPEEQISDRSERFQVAEIVREKFMLRLHDEIPYGLTVEVQAMESSANLLRIAATVWLERESQKAIVIGKGGGQIKACGTAARVELERLFDNRVHLDLRVKVKEHWADRERELQNFGFDAE
ncbi:MAG: GTPase Era [Gammaproteobacteria bacterium]